MTTCTRCGQDFDRDPALEVACPKCRAAIGEQCRRPSGHPVNMLTSLHGIHAYRGKKALREGVYEPCPEGPNGGDLEAIDLTYSFEDGATDYNGRDQEATQMEITEWS